MSAYVIIANGDFLSKSFIQTMTHGKTIVALDGAVNKLLAFDIKPHIIVGDFDSLDTDTQRYWDITKTFNAMDVHSKPYLGRYDTLIVPSKDQSKTDLVKGIHYCDSQNASDIILLCALGGRIDHDEGNKRALRLEYKKSRPITLYTETHMLRYVKDETIHVTGKIHDKVAVLGYPRAVFSSTGLEYEGDDSALNFGYDSICNALKNPQATIVIQGEAVVMLPIP
jgi:thiamine pyrophosphokinase